MPVEEGFKQSFGGQPQHDTWGEFLLYETLRSPCPSSAGPLKHPGREAEWARSANVRKGRRSADAATGFVEKPILSVTTRWNLVHTTCTRDAPTVNKQQHLWPEMHRCLWSQHPLPGPHSPGGSKKGSADVEEPLAFFVGGEKLAVLKLCSANSKAWSSEDVRCDWGE